VPEEARVADLAFRSELRKLICAGDVAKAFAKLRLALTRQDWVAMSESGAFQRLHELRFVEFLRNKQFLEAVRYAREELSAQSARKLLTLVAFRDPTQVDDFKHYFDEDFRDEVAGVVNQALLALETERDVRKLSTRKRRRKLELPRSALETITAHASLARLQCIREGKLPFS